MLTLLACALPSPEFGNGGPRDVEPTVTQADGRNVYTVSWDTLTAGSATVHYGEDGAFDHTAVGTSSDDGLHHEVVLAGLAGGVEWEGTVDGGAPFTLTPEAPPENLPALDLTIPPGDDVSGYTLSLIFNHPEATIVLLDRQARLVWWQPVEDTGVFRALYDEDSRSIVWLDRGTDGTGRLWRSTLEGQPELVATLPSAHHDLAPAPDGGWYVLGYEPREVTFDGSLVTVLGDQLFHVSADGGEVNSVWSSWDEFTYSGESVSTGNGREYPHTNSVVVDPETGDVILSIYMADAILAVDPGTGCSEWQLGGANSDWAVDVGFARQHSPVLADGGTRLFVFDNGDGDDPAEAAVYDLDWDSFSAQRSWSWDQDGSHELVAMGSAAPVAETGSTLVAWGTDATYTQVSDQGEVEWQADWSGDSVGFSTHLDELAGATR